MFVFIAIIKKFFYPCKKNKYTKYLTNLHNIMREREKKKKI